MRYEHNIPLVVNEFTGSWCCIKENKTKRNGHLHFKLNLRWFICMFSHLPAVPICGCLSRYVQEWIQEWQFLAIRQFFTSAVFAMTLGFGLHTAIALIWVNVVFRPYSFVWSKWIAFALFLLSFICLFLATKQTKLCAVWWRNIDWIWSNSDFVMTNIVVSFVSGDIW